MAKRETKSYCNRYEDNDIYVWYSDYDDLYHVRFFKGVTRVHDMLREFRDEIGISAPDFKTLEEVVVFVRKLQNLEFNVSNFLESLENKEED